MKLRVGDRVICVDARSLAAGDEKFRLVKGQTYSVTGIKSGGVMVDNKPYGWFPHRFKIAPPIVGEPEELAQELIEEYRQEARDSKEVNQ